MSAAPVPPGSPEPSHRSVLLTAAAVAACFLIFGGIVWIAYVQQRPTKMDADLSKVDEGDRWKFTAEGRAQRLADVRGRVDQLSTRYDWIDKNAGVVRLPIDRAMELVVQEHDASKH